MKPSLYFIPLSGISRPKTELHFFTGRELVSVYHCNFTLAGYLEPFLLVRRRLQIIRGHFTRETLDFLKVPRGCRWPRAFAPLSRVSRSVFAQTPASCIFFSLPAQLSKLDLYASLERRRRSSE